MRVLALIYRHRHAGCFSNLTKIVEAMKQLEESEDLSYLLIVDRRSSARRKTVKFSFDRLKEQLKELGRADIRDGREKDPLPVRYGVMIQAVDELDLSVLDKNRD